MLKYVKLFGVAMENIDSAEPTDLISVSEARTLLQVSHTKMTQLIKDGYIRYFQNPLDRRVKFVSQAEVLALIPKRQIGHWQRSGA